MDSVEDEIVNEDYDGLHNRGARKKLAQDKYFENKEAAEIRELATAAVLRKIEHEEAEKQRKRLEAQTLTGSREKTEREVFIDEELNRVRQVLPVQELKSCVIDMVRVEMTITKHRSLTLLLRFPLEYPEESLNIDITSQTLSPDLMAKLKAGAEREAKCHVGDQQVLSAYKLIKSFLESNKLAPAYDDVKQIQELFKGTPCALKSSKEKTGVIHIKLIEEKYFMDLKFTVPEEYPERAVGITLNDGNLSSDMQNTIIVQSEDRGRRLAEPPKVGRLGSQAVGRAGAGSGHKSKSEKLAQNQSLQSRKMQGELQARAEDARKKAEELQKRLIAEHVAKPSLFPIVKYILEDGLQALASGKCRICNKRLIPSDPAKISKIPKEMATFRLYCGHMYHFKCIEEYVSSPPFGKSCLACGKKIEHKKLTTDVKVLEQRWMHKQAREREIADVADFMAF